MTTSFPPRPADRKPRLMRCGMCLAGTGLLGGLSAAAALVNGWALRPIAVAALICSAAALVLLGFAAMVVGADPFPDEDLDEPAA